MSSKFGGHHDLLPAPVPRDFVEHVYSSPNGIDLEARIWPAKNASVANSPWILWCHGGGYAAGSHYAPPTWVVPGFTSRGIHLVTMGYRLSPHASLSDQVDDCTASFTWCRQNLAKVLGGKVAIERYGVGGDSAGGTLSTLLGLKLTPAPKVVIDVYGNIDLLAPRHWKIFPPSEVNLVSDEFPMSAILKECETRDPSRAIVHAPFPWELASIPEKVTQDRWAAPQFTYTERVRFQTAIKDYLGASKANIFYLLDLDKLPDEESRRAYAKKWSPSQLVDEVEEYPPTAFLHATADAAVPIAMSQHMAARLREIGVPTLESYEEGGPHAFDMIYKGPEVDGYTTYITPVLDFAEKYLRQ